MATPAYHNAPAQYSIEFNSSWIECTGYLPNLAAAKRFVAKRYGKGKGCTIEATYPPTMRDGIKHTV